MRNCLNKTKHVSKLDDKWLGNNVVVVLVLAFLRLLNKSFRQKRLIHMKIMVYLKENSSLLSLATTELTSWTEWELQGRPASPSTQILQYPDLIVS